jgi:hypothetical protein
MYEIDSTVSIAHDYISLDDAFFYKVVGENISSIVYLLICELSTWNKAGSGLCQGG